MKASKSRPYGNFRDLRGLLVRMLKSRNRSAYATLLHEALAKLAMPMDFVLSRWERRRVAAAEPSDLPVVLIVGMPRAGTTIVCQVLSRYLDVTYLNNLSALFPRSPITASRWFSRLLTDRRPDFTSYYGKTPRLADPNEGFHVWNRWLGTDRYRAAASLDPEIQDDMMRFFDAWLSAFGKPFLSKSVRNTDAVSLLARTIRNCYFIGVRRNRRMLVQSLILARQHVQGSKALGWGLYSREEAVHSDPLGYVDDVCKQVMQMESRFELAKAELGADQFLEVDYEAFCRDPEATVKAVASLVPNVRVLEQRVRDELRPFSPSKKSRLTAEEIARMEDVFQCARSGSNPEANAEGTMVH